MNSQLKGHTMNNVTFVKTTESGLRVEVINGVVCINGQTEAHVLVEVGEHPNRQAIIRAVPRATHMAGRLPLTEAEAAVVQGAMAAASNAFDFSERAIAERLRVAVYERQAMAGVE